MFNDEGLPVATDWFTKDEFMQIAQHRSKPHLIRIFFLVIIEWVSTLKFHLSKYLKTLCQ